MSIVLELTFLFGAGFLAGIVNSIAGGGSFITFPSLLFVGVNPISANATNTFSSCAGYLSGAYALREELYKYKADIPKLVISSVIGGITGAWLLLKTPEALFQQAIPWLLLFSTLLFIFGGTVNRYFTERTVSYKHASLVASVILLLLLFAICVYGGFFNAGLGIIVLSYLALAGHSDINVMNGMKLLISSVVSLIAIVLFIHDEVIAWYEGSIVLIGTLLGGYAAAHLSKRLSQRNVRGFIIFASCLITTYFFFDVYAK